LKSYYGDFDGVEVEMTTFVIDGTEDEEAPFVVPKYMLMFASPVFQRMFAYEMTEKTTGKVKIKDTTPEEFGDFLKAISPKQEHPNREFDWKIGMSSHSHPHNPHFCSIECFCFAEVGRPIPVSIVARPLRGTSDELSGNSTD
jgi:hypothetical protein